MEISQEDFERLLGENKTPDGVFRGTSSKDFGEALTIILCSFTNEQFQNILDGNIEIYDCWRTNMLEASLQSQLNNKPITNEKVKKI